MFGYLMRLFSALLKERVDSPKWKALEERSDKMDRLHNEHVELLAKATAAMDNEEAIGYLESARVLGIEVQDLIDGSQEILDTI